MASPFVDGFRAIVELLFGRVFTEADGISDEELDAIQSRCGYELPDALRDFYAVLGRFDPVLGAHNRFYPAACLNLMDNKRVFCEENQVVVYWGYDEDQGWQTDPPVYQGINGDQIEWHVEADRCSYFLSGMIYWQALYGALPKQRFGDAPASVRHVALTWPIVWQDEATQVFSSGPVVFSLTRRDDDMEIQAAALSETELEKLWRALGLGGDEA
jgi:hypothetical protein